MSHHRHGLEDSEFISDNLVNNSPDAQIRRRIQNRINARNTFYFSLLGFLSINAMLWGIWLAVRDGFPWPIFITLPWGIGLMSQVFQIVQYSPEAAAQREVEIQQEVDAEKRRMGGTHEQS